MKDIQAEHLIRALCGQLCIPFWQDANDLLARGVGPSHSCGDSEGANFHKWAGPMAFSATPFQVNTTSSLKLCFSFMCILLHVEEQYGSRKKVLGQIMQYGWKCFPCADLA